jgi:phosphatidylglycerol:prolipoprotein diacylglycerol transferase
VAVITIGIDPEVELGPVTLTWHGTMIAVGILVGGMAAQRFARGRGLRSEAIFNLVLVVALAGMVGARAFYLLENDTGALIRPGDWLGTRGFSFYGAILFGVPAAGLYLRRRGLGLPFLDALALGFPLGMAVGRIGDVINGEHFGPPSDLPWAFRYTHPDALTPSSKLAYHSGGFYEIVLALTILAIVWPLRDRLRQPGAMLWLVIGLYALGRFAMFFVREDSELLALGLNGAQWTSLLLIAVAGFGLWRAGAARLVGATRAAGSGRCPPRAGRGRDMRRGA